MSQNQARMLYHRNCYDDWDRRIKDNASRDNICVQLDESELAKFSGTS